MIKSNIFTAVLSILLAVTAALLGFIFFSGQPFIHSSFQQSEDKSSFFVLKTTSNKRTIAFSEQLLRYAGEYIHKTEPLSEVFIPYNVKSGTFVLTSAQFQQSNKTKGEQTKNNFTESEYISEQTLQQAMQILQSVGNKAIGDDILSQLSELGLNDEQIAMIQNFPSFVSDDSQIQEDARLQHNSSSSSSKTQLKPDNSGNWLSQTSTQEFPFWHVVIIVAGMLIFIAIVILWIQKSYKAK